jgi:FkbM family methyltransferase
MKTTDTSVAETFKRSYSQSGEDLIVDFILRALRMGLPSYLDIGAYRPTFINNTYHFYERGGAGILVEPNPFLFEELKKIRPRDTILNVGVGAKEEKEKDFYILTSATLSTFSGEEMERLTASGNQKVEKVLKIPVRDINSLIEEYFSPAPHFISLDVEGGEMEILTSLDFSRFKPEVLCIETLEYSDENKEKKEKEIIDFMERKGYMVYADTYINTIFVDRLKWRQRKRK